MEGDKLTFTNAIKHHINTKDDIPVYTKSYRYPYCHKEEVQNQIDKLLEQGIISPSNSPWSSPIWIVPKKNFLQGVPKWRLVIDYRKVNQKTISDRYPIPNITEILDKLGRSIYFTTLDLASGFHQIEVFEKDIPKTAFSVDNGHYEFLRMPFGLKNAPSTLQRVLDDILRPHIGKQCLVYMDDIIVFSTSLQEHMINLREIFETLRKYDLKIQLEKTKFLHKEVAFLGHIVTPEGVKPNPEKNSIIPKWPIPKSEKELRTFLGVIGYYRKFIQDFAKITKPFEQAKELTIDN